MVLPLIPISLWGLPQSKKSLKPAIRKWGAVITEVKGEVTAIDKKMHLLVPRRSLLKAKLAKANIKAIYSPYDGRSGDQVSVVLL